jgi:hypothetical protein
MTRRTTGISAVTSGSGAAWLGRSPDRTALTGGTLRRDGAPGDPSTWAAGAQLVGGSSRGAKTSSMGRGPMYCRQLQATQVCPAQRPRLV